MKDLFDAVKEAYSQNEPMLETGGWRKVRASMRRASVVRSLAWAGGAVAACAACVLFSVRIPDDSNIRTVPVLDAVPKVSAEAVKAVQPVGESAKLSDVPAYAPPGNPAPPKETVTIPVAPSIVAVTPPVASSFEASPETEQQASVVSSFAPEIEIAEASETQPDYWWEDASVSKKRQRVTISFSASASPVSSATSNVFIPQMEFLAVLKSNSFLNNCTDSEVKSLFNNFSSETSAVRYVHDLPVGFGIALNFPLSERFSLETGLNYNYLHSVEDDNGSLSDQRLHFVGIPLRADFKLVQKRLFSLYTGAGFSVEKCLKASVGSRSYNETRFQWSGEAFAGAEYNLWKSTYLYLQPTVSYWFTETDLITYRTENPLVFSVSAGLRFRL